MEEVVGEMLFRGQERDEKLLKLLGSSSGREFKGAETLGAIVDKVDDDGVRDLDLGFLIDFYFFLRLTVFHHQQQIK